MSWEPWKTYFTGTITILLALDAWLGRINRGFRLTKRFWHWGIAVIKIPNTLTTIEQRLSAIESVKPIDASRRQVEQPYMEPRFGVNWRIDPAKREIADTIFCTCCQPPNILRHIDMGNYWYCDKGKTNYDLRDLHHNHLNMYDAHQLFTQQLFGA